MPLADAFAGMRHFSIERDARIVSASADKPAVRMKTKLREIKEALRQRTNRPILETGKWLAQGRRRLFCLSRRARPTAWRCPHSDIMSSSFREADDIAY